MAITATGHGSSLNAQVTAASGIVTGGTLFTFTASQDPGSGITVGDLLVIRLSANGIIGTSPNVVTFPTPSGWTLSPGVASSSQVGISYFFFQSTYAYYRVADGTAADRPTWLYSKVGTGVAELSARAHMFGFRAGGGTWALGSSGAGGGVATPHDGATFTRSIPGGALIVDITHNYGGSNVPTVSTAYSFTSAYTDGAAVYTVPRVGIATRVTPTTPNPDTISFPAWSNATSWNSSQSATAYAVFTFTPTPGGWRYRGTHWGGTTPQGWS